jgi:hypothetical protein
MTTASILWQRLDTSGHDACFLEGDAAGWTIEGTAVFREGGVTALLAYRVNCDLTWCTRQGKVFGRLGEKPVEFQVARTTEGIWTLNGETVSDLETCLDLDVGFSPATNLLPLRRLALIKGQAADAPAAWLNVSTGTLELLPQRYERRTESTYWYEAPSVGYAGLLEITPVGFIHRYPGLWEEVY